MNFDSFGPISQAVTAACQKLAPIDGVSFGDLTDTRTWRVDFQTAATDDQKKAVATYIAALDLKNPPVPVPMSVSPYQARVALSAAGLRANVEAAVTAAPQSVQDAWQYGTTVDRNSPMIASFGAALGLTDAQIDALFVAAGNVT